MTISSPRSGASAYRSHAASVHQAWRRGFAPGRPLRDPPRLLRVAVGMLVATLATTMAEDEVARLLIIVGAFLGAIACLMPHRRPRVESAAGTGLALVIAVHLGSLLGDRWAVAFPLMAVGFFLAGLLRAVAIGLAMRTLVVVIVFTAFCEVAPGLPDSAAVLARDFGIGVALMVAAQLLPPFDGRHDTQRRAVSALYRAVAAGGPTLAPLLAAQRSVALVHLRWSHTSMGRYAALVSIAEDIDDHLVLLDEQNSAQASTWREATAARLNAVADRLDRVSAPTNDIRRDWPGVPSDVSDHLVTLVERAERAVGGDDVGVAPSRRTPSAWEILRDELTAPRSPFFHHGLRLAGVAVLSMTLGLWMGRHLPHELALNGHGFWVVVAGVLIMFPDYGDTFSRGAGRTVGTIAGAALGIGVAALNLPTAAHAWALFALFLGYLAFRSCGQPFTMFFVVAWIAGLSPGASGALTRGLDTVVGCVVAFVVFLLAPTWHSTRVGAAFDRALADQAERLRAILAYGDNPASPESVTRLAHATTTAHLSLSDLGQAVHSAAAEPAHHHCSWSPEPTAQALGAVDALSRTVGALRAAVSRTSESGTPAAGERLDAADAALGILIDAPGYDSQPLDAQPLDAHPLDAHPLDAHPLSNPASVITRCDAARRHLTDAVRPSSTCEPSP